MPPKLILIRHAEAEHNATCNWDLLDPPLTENGLEQCKTLQKHLQENCPLASKVERIISSPMHRTCQTTLTALSWLIESGVPVELDAMWQENSTNPCDSGSPLGTISKSFPTLDFSRVDPIYPSKDPSTPYAWTRAANRARGDACLRDLYHRPEKVIAVVSHAGFLRTGISKRRYANADYRCFEFRRRGRGEKEKLELVGDGQTERRGGGMGRSEKGVFEVQDWDFPE
ncbi:Putative histidine phosphatase superfamily, clade-1 [Septoria linicola]|uniref:Histidine phosphatase superfamily, clade-1 n=1 Tax=Septoria linicola TaxID=215465 RepID=A0A9Q9ENR4_9PEZI|nr:Putative histidine phosphatase superfamily, clade-1 [Septoria linicola]